MKQQKGSGRKWTDMGGDEISRVGFWSPDCTEAGGSREHQTPPDTFWDKMKRLAVWCDATLQRQDFPDAAAQIRANVNGIWCYVVDDDEPMDEDRADASKIWQGYGGLYAAIHTSRLSDVWYAGDLGIKIWQLEVARENLTDHHLGLILQIGIAMKDLEWRRKFGSDILGYRASKVAWRKGGAQGAAALKTRAEKARTVIADLALASEHLTRWVGLRQTPRIRYLRKLAAQCDEGRSDDERLFVSPRGGQLSDRWFGDRISDWAADGSLARSLESVSDKGLRNIELVHLQILQGP